MQSATASNNSKKHCMSKTVYCTGFTVNTRLLIWLEIDYLYILYIQVSLFFCCILADYTSNIIKE